MITIKKNPETVGKLKVGTSAATPADGDIIASGMVTVSNATEAKLRLENTKNWGSSDSGNIGTLEFYTTDPNGVGARVAGAVECAQNAGSAAPNGELVFKTAAGGGSAAAAVERMRIDSTGNVTQTGGEFVLQDGSGANVGKISTLGSNNITISGAQANHCGMSFATNAILPCTVSVVNNNTVDLGASGNAYKDLYLAGGVNLGDTTLSNYKEGTWTPVLAISGGNDGGTLTQTAGELGKYVRIGKMVHVMGIINVTAASGLSGATTIVQVNGFPFTADVNATYNYQYQLRFSREDALTSRKPDNFISFYSASTIGFIYDSGLGTGITGNELTTGKLVFRFIHNNLKWH